MSGAEQVGDQSRTSPTNPRYDVHRREKIVAAALDVIGDVGVSGASMRKVADHAGVPLGSLTYYFGSRDELLRAAFEEHAETVAAKFESRMSHASCPASAQEEIVALIMEDMFANQRELVLNQELYTLAARIPAFREITDAWMARSRAALSQQFDPDTARGLDALIEGLTLHGALGTHQLDQRFVAAMVGRICPV